MRVVYSDEWGVGSLDQEPITVVAGVVLNMDSQWDAVESDLSEAIRQIPNRLLFERKELKGRLLLKSIRKKDRYADAAKKGLAEILSLVPKHGLHIFHGAIDRRGYDNSKRNFNISDMRTTGYQLEAFDECLTRLDDFVHNFLPREKVLWIADKTGYETHLKDGLAFYQRLQVTDFVHYENKVVEVARSDPQPSHVLDTIYFGHSHRVACLAACGCVLHRHRSTPAEVRRHRTVLHSNSRERGNGWPDDSIFA